MKRRRCDHTRQKARLLSQTIYQRFMSVRYLYLRLGSCSFKREDNSEKANANIYYIMASLSFTSSSFRPPELSFGNGNYGNTVKVHRRKKSISVPFAANSPDESLSVPPEKPEIELDFIGVHSTFKMFHLFFFFF